MVTKQKSLDAIPVSFPQIKRLGSARITGRSSDQRIKMLNKYHVNFLEQNGLSVWQNQNDAIVEPVQGLRLPLPFGMEWNRLNHLRRSPR